MVLVWVDHEGRITIPHEVRERLSIAPGAELELLTEGGSIRLSPVGLDHRSIVEVNGTLVLARTEGHTVTGADVRRWRDADQR